MSTFTQPASERHTRAPRRPLGATVLLRASLVAAASASLVGLTAGPSNAASSTVSVVAGNDVSFVGNEFANEVTVRSDPSGAVFINDKVSTVTPGPGCTRVSTGGVKCAAAAGQPRIDFIALQLGDGSDEAVVQSSIRTRIDGQNDNDTYLGATTSTGTRVFFDGGPGAHDRVDYGFSNLGVLVALGSSSGDTPFDGRLGIDDDNIASTVEDVFGSDHADSLRANEGANLVIGRLGADALRGGPGNDEIRAEEFSPGGSEADKADLSCGKGTDVIVVDNVDPNTAECETVRRVS